MRSGRRSFLPLSGPHRFDAVFSEGTRVRRGGLTIIAMARHPGPARVGLVAGRRVGGAVARNLARRRLRGALDRVGLSDGVDYVVVATPSVATASYSAVLSWVCEAIELSTERARERPAGGTEESVR